MANGLNKEHLNLNLNLCCYRNSHCLQSVLRRDDGPPSISFYGGRLSETARLDEAHHALVIAISDVDGKGRVKDVNETGT